MFSQAIAEVGFVNRSILGDADNVMAKLVAEPGSTYHAVLADDSDFFIYRNCRCITSSCLVFEASGEAKVGYIP